jgi:ribosomal protein S5
MSIAIARRRHRGHAIPAIMELVSRGRPADDISPQVAGGSGTAGNAVDAAYNTFWRMAYKQTAAQPQRIAIDLSHLTTAQKASILYHWRNDSTRDFYDPTDLQTSGNFNCLPRDYKIQGHAGAGGGAAPAIGDAGWVDLATVTGNVYRDRVHAITLTGYNWVALRATDGNGPPGNDDMAAQIEVFNVAQGRRDSWLHLGDSIVAECMNTRNLDGSPWTNGPLAQQITALRPGRIPLMRNGGVPTTTSDFGATNRAALLSGQINGIVSIGFGTNDAAAGNITKAIYKANISALATDALAAGNWVIVSLVPQRTNNTVADASVVQYNAAILELAQANPAIRVGPDFYTAVANGTIPLRDNIHPTYVGAGNGYEVMQAIWANWIAANIY